MLQEEGCVSLKPLAQGSNRSHSVEFCHHRTGGLFHQFFDLESPGHVSGYVYAPDAFESSKRRIQRAAFSQNHQYRRGSGVSSVGNQGLKVGVKARGTASWSAPYNTVPSGYLANIPTAQSPVFSSQSSSDVCSCSAGEAGAPGPPGSDGYSG